MSHQRFPFLLSLSFLMTAGLSAQGVRFRGEVEDVSGTQNQFVVDCTNVALTSSTLNLNLFVGEQVEIVGTWNGNFAAPSVEVTALTNVIENFEIGGDDEIGGTANLHVIGAPGDTVLFFGALESGFFPLPSAGAVLIDPASAEILATGTIGGSGQLEVPAPIPNDPALVGFVYHAQALVRSSTSGTFSLTTNDCKEIRLN